MKQLLASLLLLLALTAPAATSSNFVATITVTNTAGTTNGQTLTVGSDTRTWTNSVYVSASQILTNNTLAGAALNLLLQVSANPFANLTLNGDGTTKITLTTLQNVARPTVTLSDGWGTVTWATNYFTQAIVYRYPYTVEPSAMQTNLATSMAESLSKSTSGISMNAGGTNSFGHTTFTDPPSGFFLTKRTVDGLVDGTLDASASGSVLTNFTLMMPTNSESALPAAASWPGACFIWNSNSVLYVIISGPASTTWTSTNKLAP